MGVSHLQYAEDTLVLIESTDLGIANLKFLLLCFENMLGLKINFDKSEATMTGVTADEQRRVANMLNCKLGKLPMKYLGLPVSSKLLRVADWEFLPEKVGHRVDRWQGLFLASASRLELTNSCLSSLPMFAMGIYLLHDSTHYAMDRPRSRFFWEGVGNKRKYHMVDWPTVCKPKQFGGLGILNTKIMNIALMLKWIWRIYQNIGGLWADLLRANYLGARDFFSKEVPTRGTQFWNAIQKIKWYIKLGAKHRVHNEKGPISRWIGGWGLGRLGPDTRASLVAVRTPSSLDTQPGWWGVSQAKGSSISVISLDWRKQWSGITCAVRSRRSLWRTIMTVSRGLWRTPRSSLPVRFTAICCRVQR
jgi:hypothetical protein